MGDRGGAAPIRPQGQLAELLRTRGEMGTVGDPHHHHPWTNQLPSSTRFFGRGDMQSLALNFASNEGPDTATRNDGAGSQKQVSLTAWMATNW